MTFRIVSSGACFVGWNLACLNILAR